MRSKLFTCYGDGPPFGQPEGTVEFFVTGEGHLKITMQNFIPDAIDPTKSVVVENSLILRRNVGSNQPASIRHFLLEVI